MDDDQADIKRIRADYAEERAYLETAMVPFFNDAASVVDALLSMADEFGAEHAMTYLSDTPQQFGELRGRTIQAEAVKVADGRLSGILETHDQLDDLVGKLKRMPLLRSCAERSVRFPPRSSRASCAIDAMHNRHVNAIGF